MPAAGASIASVVASMQATVENFARQLGYYFELTKPRVCLLLVFTAAIGMAVAPQPASWLVVFCALAGIWLAAASAASLNHLIERHIDSRMQRTRERPLARGKLSYGPVIAFSLALGLLSMYVLATCVNPLTATLALASLLGYAFIYTIWLKRATSQNIVIGGIFGATPPLLGYAAVSNEVGMLAAQMALIIFLWTPPHFWALAIARREDYLSAGLPMLPITHGNRHTALNVLLYTVMLMLASALPWLTFQAGVLYLACSIVLGTGYLYYAWQLYVKRTLDSSMSAFYYSLHYLIWLFCFLLIDNALSLG